MKHIIPAVTAIERPIWTHVKPCGKCPSAHGPGDPESDDILSWPEGTEGREDFSCAWRPGGFCQGWAKQLRRKNAKK